MFKPLSKLEEIDKLETLATISTITSARNPDRIQDMAFIRSTFAEKAKALDAPKIVLNQEA